MDRIRINGGRELRGRIAIGGAKNAALPLMAAGLLSEGPLTLRNAPDLADIANVSVADLTQGDTIAAIAASVLERCISAELNFPRRMP